VCAAQFEKLVKDMKATAGSRFNAANYLEKHDRNLTILIAMTSCYLVGMTIIPYFLKLPTKVAAELNLFTVICSIVILVSAILQNSQRNAVNAEQHHRSALEINELRRTLEVRGNSISTNDLEEFTSKYAAVLQKYSINHATLDYQKYLAENPEKFPWVGRITRYRIYLCFAARDYAALIWLCVITVIFIVIVVCRVMPSLALG
jgi:hypothetical protein